MTTSMRQRNFTRKIRDLKQTKTKEDNYLAVEMRVDTDESGVIPHEHKNLT